MLNSNVLLLWHIPGSASSLEHLFLLLNSLTSSPVTLPSSQVTTSHPVQATWSITQTTAPEFYTPNPPAGLPPPPAFPTQYVAKPHAPISAAAHFLYFYTGTAGHCWRKPHSLTEWGHLYPQMPGSISASPASSSSSLSRDVFKVCTLSLSGYVFFTFKIWSSSYFVRKMRQSGHNSFIFVPTSNLYKKTMFTSTLTLFLPTPS